MIYLAQIYLAFLGLFTVALFAALVYGHYVDRRHLLAIATPRDHARMAQIYEIRAEGYRSQAIEQRKLACKLGGRKLTAALSHTARTTDHFEFVASQSRQRADTMNELAHKHKKMAGQPARSALATMPMSRRNAQIPASRSLFIVR